MLNGRRTAHKALRMTVEIAGLRPCACPQGHQDLMRSLRPPAHSVTSRQLLALSAWSLRLALVRSASEPCSLLPPAQASAVPATAAAAATASAVAAGAGAAPAPTAPAQGPPSARAAPAAAAAALLPMSLLAAAAQRLGGSCWVIMASTGLHRLAASGGSGEGQEAGSWAAGLPGGREEESLGKRDAKSSAAETHGSKGRLRRRSGSNGSSGERCGGQGGGLGVYDLLQSSEEEADGASSSSSSISSSSANSRVRKRRRSSKGTSSNAQSRRKRQRKMREERKGASRDASLALAGGFGLAAAEGGQDGERERGEGGERGAQVTYSVTGRATHLLLQQQQQQQQQQPLYVIILPVAASATPQSNQGQSTLPSPPPTPAPLRITGSAAEVADVLACVACKHWLLQACSCGRE